MKASKATHNATPEIEVYRDFMRLGREPRRRIAVRFSHGQKIMADLYDHFLIQRSLEESEQNFACETLH